MLACLEYMLQHRERRSRVYLWLEWSHTHHYVLSAFGFDIGFYCQSLTSHMMLTMLIIVFSSGLLTYGGPIRGSARNVHVCVSNRVFLRNSVNRFIYGIDALRLLS